MVVVARFISNDKNKNNQEKINNMFFFNKIYLASINNKLSLQVFLSNFSFRLGFLVICP